LLSLVLLGISLYARQQNHGKLSLARPILLVDDDFLRDWREGRELSAHHIAAFGAHGDLEAAVGIRGGDVLFPSKRVGCADTDTGQRYIARLHRSRNFAEGAGNTCGDARRCRSRRLACRVGACVCWSGCRASRCRRCCLRPGNRSWDRSLCDESSCRGERNKKQKSTAGWRSAMAARRFGHSPGSWLVTPGFSAEIGPEAYLAAWSARVGRSPGRPS